MDERDVTLALALGCTVPDARRYRANADRLRAIVDVWKMEPFTMVKLKAPGFMDLTVERLNDREASLTHYGEMNGDLMADPDVVMEIAEDGAWVRAVTFRNDYAALALGVRPSDYRDGKNLAGLRDLNRFLTTWLENIRAQGHRLPDGQGP